MHTFGRELLKTMDRLEFNERQEIIRAKKEGWKVVGRDASFVRVEVPAGASLGTDKVRTVDFWAKYWDAVVWPPKPRKMSPSMERFMLREGL